MLLRFADLRFLRLADVFLAFSLGRGGSGGSGGLRADIALLGGESVIGAALGGRFS